MPKRVAIGVVTSDKMAKTRVVEIPRLVQHAKYGKYIRQRTKCYVHDEAGQANLGDTVEIIECRPRSKSKRWELVRVVEKHSEADRAAMASVPPEGGLEPDQTQG
jgi:small subunit ribosomal protein S17